MRAVVITGTSTGIGEACALQLDKLGWRVFAGVRKLQDGENLKKKASANLTPVIIDVTDEASIASAAETVATAVGQEGLQGLVNNAGIAVAGPLEFLPIAELRKQLDINVTGLLAVTQAFLPLLRKGNGRIVNIGSVSGLMASPMVGPYSASKFALEALTDSLRMELSPWKISVSIIEPSEIATPIWDKGLVAAQDLEKEMSAQAHEYYDPMIGAVKRVVKGASKNGAPTELVSTAVEHALSSPKPKTRYLVGKGSRLRKLIQRLPDRTRDRLIMGQLNKIINYKPKG